MKGLKVIRNYTKEDKQKCIDIFISNEGKYFAKEELEEFEQFLNRINKNIPYYVLEEDMEISACGGIGKDNETAILTWGMVKRNLHKNGLGTKLIEFRLNEIKRLWGNIPVKIETSQYTQVFFQLKGFEITEIIKDGFDIGLDNYKMIKKL